MSRLTWCFLTRLFAAVEVARRCLRGFLPRLAADGETRDVRGWSQRSGHDSTLVCYGDGILVGSGVVAVAGIHCYVFNKTRYPVLLSPRSADTPYLPTLRGHPTTSLPPRS